MMLLSATNGFTEVSCGKDLRDDDLPDLFVVTGLEVIPSATDDISPFLFLRVIGGSGFSSGAFGVGRDLFRLTLSAINVFIDIS